MAFKSKNQPSNGDSEKNRPVHSIRSGVLSVSIWEQTGSNGTFYRVTAQRAYKPDDAEDWQHTDSFGRDDIMTIAKLLDLAHTWILRAEQENRKEAR